MSPRGRVTITPFADVHADGVAAVCRKPGWPTYAAANVARRGCTDQFDASFPHRTKRGFRTYPA